MEMDSSHHNDDDSGTQTHNTEKLSNNAPTITPTRLLLPQHSLFTPQNQETQQLRSNSQSLSLLTPSPILRKRKTLTMNSPTTGKHARTEETSQAPARQPVDDEEPLQSTESEASTQNNNKNKKKNKKNVAKKNVKKAKIVRVHDRWDWYETRRDYDPYNDVIAGTEWFRQDDDTSLYLKVELKKSTKKMRKSDADSKVKRAAKAHKKAIEENEEETTDDDALDVDKIVEPTVTCINSEPRFLLWSRKEKAVLFQTAAALRAQAMAGSDDKMVTLFATYPDDNVDGMREKPTKSSENAIELQEIDFLTTPVALNILVDLIQDQSALNLRPSWGYPGYQDDKADPNCVGKEFPDDESVGKVSRQRNRQTWLLPGLCREIGGLNVKGMLLKRPRQDYLLGKHFALRDIRDSTTWWLEYIMNRPTGLSCCQQKQAVYGLNGFKTCRCSSDLKEALEDYCRTNHPDETFLTVPTDGKKTKVKLSLLPDYVLAIFHPLVRLLDGITNINKNPKWDAKDIHRFLIQSNLVPYHQGGRQQCGSLNYQVTIPLHQLKEHKDLEPLVGKIQTCHGVWAEACGIYGNYSKHRLDGIIKYCLSHTSSRELSADDGDWKKYVQGGGHVAAPSMAVSVYTFAVYPKKCAVHKSFQASISTAVVRGHSEPKEIPPWKISKPLFIEKYWGKILNGDKLVDAMSDPTFKMLHFQIDAIMLRQSKTEYWKRYSHPISIADWKLPYSHEGKMVPYRGKVVQPPPIIERYVQKGFNDSDEIKAQVKDMRVVVAADEPVEPKSIEHHQELFGEDAFEDMESDEEGTGEVEYATDQRYYNLVDRTKGKVSFVQDSFELKHSCNIVVVESSVFEDLLHFGEVMKNKSYNRDSDNNRMVLSSSKNYVQGPVDQNGVVVDEELSMLLSGLGMKDTDGQICGAIHKKILWAAHMALEMKNKVENNNDDDEDDEDSLSCIISIHGSYSFGIPNCEVQSVELPHLPYSPEELQAFEKQHSCQVMKVLVPCSEDGCVMKYWSSIDKSRERKDCQWGGRYIHVRYGSMLLYPASTIQAGGYYISFGGSPCLHLTVLVASQECQHQLKTIGDPFYVVPGDGKGIKKGEGDFLQLFPPMTLKEDDDEVGMRSLVDIYGMLFFRTLQV